MHDTTQLRPLYIQAVTPMADRTDNIIDLCHEKTDLKGALYGFQLADTWWTIVALFHVGAPS